MRRALVVEHIEIEGAGALAEWLPAAGLDLDYHRVHEDGAPPDRLPEGYAALVVMGGAMGVADAATTHPWLTGEMALIRRTVDAGVPVLGVCLGAQLLAAACGGTVAKARVGPELGVCRIHLTDAAERDPLLAGLPPIVDVVQWHWDEVVTLPPHSVHLAASPAVPHQAFRVGDRAWGWQFHPEATPDMVRRWAADDGEDPDLFGTAADGHWPANAALWAPVAARFARLVQDDAATASKEMAGPSFGGL